MSVNAKQKVLWFEIAVDDVSTKVIKYVLRVNVVQPTKDLQEVKFRLMFLHPLDPFQLVEQLATGAIFYNKKKYIRQQARSDSLFKRQTLAQ